MTGLKLLAVVTVSVGNALFTNGIYQVSGSGLLALGVFLLLQGVVVGWIANQ